MNKNKKKQSSKFSELKNQFILSLGHQLKKIYFLEKLKGQYLTTCKFTKYIKACHLQEKIILQQRNINYQERLEKEKTLENKSLAQKIQKQMEITQALLDDVKQINQKYFEPLSAGYYDPEGNIKKTAKVFTTGI